MHVLNLPMSDENNWNSLIRLIKIKIYYFLIQFLFIFQVKILMISSMESTTVQLKSLKIKPALFLHKKDNKKK